MHNLILFQNWFLEIPQMYSIENLGDRRPPLEPDKGPYAVVDELVLESSPIYYSVTFCSFFGP